MNGVGLVVGAIVLAASSTQAQEYKCEIEDKYLCESTGCRPVPATAWNILNIQRETYARCDSKGCDIHDARFSPSGAFMNVQLPGRNTIAKMATIDVPMATLKKFSFHEVATQFHAVYVSYGTCRER
jgi:hypothetical protein